MTALTSPALNGSKHLELLVEKNLLHLISYPGLEKLYAERVSESLENAHPEKPAPKMVEDVERSDDRLLLQISDARKLASILDAPELAVEAERAIIQVEEKLKAPKDPKEEPSHTDTAKKQSNGTG